MTATMYDEPVGACTVCDLPIADVDYRLGRAFMVRGNEPFCKDCAFLSGYTLDFSRMRCSACNEIPYQELTQVGNRVYCPRCLPV